MGNRGYKKIPCLSKIQQTLSIYTPINDYGIEIWFAK